eukprot:CAMPEP_0197040370 /NCGR_PEP_ID=MMETSP1384-20130603/17085_1 /TAXON_ID=29189 /ORGANISM="Ammonia sp." /LENGTH=576 /DNA_ID=CAMNT_0042471113 /DNA_START=37 /DNA_END=1767 /DNA_ORIENTATION=+
MAPYTPFIFLHWLCVHILQHKVVSSTSVIKSVELTSLSNVQDGASAVAMHGIIDTYFDEWLLNSTASSSSSSNWNLLINLDESWAFDAQTPSSPNSISVTLNGFAVTDNVELELAFNVNNDYVNTKTYLKNQQNNEISPFCSQIATSTSSAPTMNSGNISKPSLDFNEMYTEFLPSQHHSKGGALKGYDNDFPLTFTVSQMANNLTKISYHSSSWNGFEQYCLFSPFDTDSALQIYVAVHGKEQELAITSIEIIHVVNGTSMASPSGSSPTETTAISSEILAKGESTVDLDYIQLLVNVLVTLGTVCCCACVLAIIMCLCRPFRVRPKLNSIASNSVMSPKLAHMHPVDASADPTGTAARSASGSEPRATEHDAETRSTISPPHSLVRVHQGNLTITATATNEEALSERTTLDVDQEVTVNLSTKVEANSTPGDEEEDEEESKQYELRMQAAADRNIDKSMNRMLHISGMDTMDLSLRPSPETSVNAAYDDVCMAMVSLDDLKSMNHAGHMCYVSRTIQTGGGSPTANDNDESPSVPLPEPGAFPAITIVDKTYSAVTERSTTVFPPLPEDHVVDI